MFDERTFIHEVEAADARRLSQLLSQPSAEEERALRIYFGDAAYEHMRALARRAEDESRSALVSLNLSTPSKGRAVVIHGIMGAELGSFAAKDVTTFDLIWVHLRNMFGGEVERLRLAAEGVGSQYDVRAVGIMKGFYGVLLLRLLVEQWDAHAFWFDWRKDINESADRLNEKLREWYGDDAPAHIVAHSMGGLVARAFILRHPERWAKMWDHEGGGRAGGRLIMLGTPNYGSFIIPQVITGVEAKVRQLALLDRRHSLEDILDIVNTFPGSYQMLPSPAILQGMAALYDSETYGSLKIPQRLLEHAREFHKSLAPVVDDKRMVYIAGYNRLTPCNIRDTRRLSSALDYDVTRLGDGRVTHELGIPRLPGDGRQISHVYFADVAHGNLAKDDTVVEAVCELLESGATERLETRLPDWLEDETRAVGAGALLAREYADRQRELIEDFRVKLDEELGETRGTEQTLTVSDLDRFVRESLLGDGPVQAGPSGAAVAGAGEAEGEGGAADEVVSVKIELVWAFIEDIGEGGAGEGKLPVVDAMSVGHYFGYSKPLMAEHALDEAISRKMLGKAPGDKLTDTERLLTLYSYRGIIRGELGQPFFIDDPRKPGRLIVLAGMGEAGRFWAPELTVLSRELCWALGRLGKEHLATVLIGAGHGNLRAEEAVNAWMRGIKYALVGSEQNDWRLKKISFVEADPRKLKVIENAILNFKADEEKEDRGQRLGIEYDALDFQALRSKRGWTVRKEIAWRLRRETKEAMRDIEAARDGDESDDVPVRITLSLEGKRYRFGAITESASVPERETTVDPKLVTEVNGQLPAAKDLRQQADSGKHLRSLLLPKDLLPAFSTSGPVVMMLDSNTARIHWEMIPEPEHSPVSRRGSDDAGGGKTERIDSFLSVGRGFTRQLRTSFAPPPEPPPPPRRVLRVLVVADPWEQNRLRGAEARGRGGGAPLRDLQRNIRVRRQQGADREADRPHPRRAVEGSPVPHPSPVRHHALRRPLHVRSPKTRQSPAGSSRTATCSRPTS